MQVQDKNQQNADDPVDYEHSTYFLDSSYLYIEQYEFLYLTSRVM